MNDLLERFEAKYIPVPWTGCWIWIGALNSKGYGNISEGGGQSAKIKLASRVSWELFKGPIPEGQNVLHHCDQTWCVNPDHLFLGSFTDNMLDMYEKGRHIRKGPIAFGVNNSRTKLTDDDVRAILASQENNCALGRQYHVAPQTIHKIKIGIRRNRLLDSMS